MKKIFTIFSILLCATLSAQSIKVVDAPSGEPLPMAMVFDKAGNYILTTDTAGTFSAPNDSLYPLIIRYMGYENASVKRRTTKVQMKPTSYELKAAVVVPQERNVSRSLCYVRSFISASSGPRSITTYTEAMGDYFFSDGRVRGFKPQLKMRTLSRENYTRFTDREARIDTVSVAKDSSKLLVSYVELPSDKKTVPVEIRNCKEFSKTFTVGGKSATKETWIKTGDRIIFQMDLLAGKKKHVMSPFLLKLVGYAVDIREAVLTCTFDGYKGEKERSLRDASSFSVSINATARGRAILRRLKTKDPVNGNGYYEIYVVQRSQLTASQANSMISNPPARSSISIRPPQGAPALDPATSKLVKELKEQEK